MAGKPQIKLAVLETAEWFDRDRITTIRPQIQQLMQFAKKDPNEFHYASFAGPESFKEILKDFAHTHGVQYIYINSHGENGKIQFPVNRSKTNVNAGTFTNCLGKTTLRGVLLGGCQLKSLAEKISAGLSKSGVWVAGYGTFVDWMEATWLDLTFLRYLFYYENDKKLAVTTQSKMAAFLGSLTGTGLGKFMEEMEFSVYMGGWEIYPYRESEEDISD